MKQSEGLFEKIMAAADLQGEPLPKTPLLELNGERRVLLENHFGVTQYSSQEICVKVSYGLICISGSELELACMSRERLVIIGSIDGVRLLKGRK